MNITVQDLIEKGGVFYDVAGSSPEEVFNFLQNVPGLPEYLSVDTLVTALCARERIMSTAIGNGISLPHARPSLIQNEADQRICVFFLKNAIDMNAQDERSVYVMFIILTQNQESHIKVLADLAGLFQKVAFRKVLESIPSKEELLKAIKELS